MPLRAVKAAVRTLSIQYYKYGKAVAPRAYLLLISSLVFITYFSLPVVRQYLDTIIIPSQLQQYHLHAATDTAHTAGSPDNSDTSLHLRSLLGTQSWHASAHVQFLNFTTARQQPKNYYVTEQIRVSYPNHRPIDYYLVQQAKSLMESLTTTVLNVNNNPSTQPVSLATICYKHSGHCLIHSPAFHKFNSEAQWRQSMQRQISFLHDRLATYENAKFDQQGNFESADAIVLTFVLNHTTKYGDSLLIWNKLLDETKIKHRALDLQRYFEEKVLQQHQQQELPTLTSIDKLETLYTSPANTAPQMLQYKFNLFPFDVSYKVQLSIVAYLAMFYVVSLGFGKSNLVKSGYTFGLAAVFLSLACYTTTLGIFAKFSTLTFHTVPWSLLLLIVNIACLENIFLLTNAVLDAGCDMIVAEKISRGLQSVGMPMTMTLIAELFILNLGTHMDSQLIKELCTFAKLALVVDYILQGTFVIAILSIDIKRVELADLDDRQVSKRLHELAGIQSEKEQQRPADFCPIQDTVNKEDSKSCAECKEFKTHRVFNAFMICLIILTLTILCPKEYQHEPSTTKSYTLIQEQLQVKQLSDNFWSIINPQKDITWLQVEPPHLFIYGNDITEAQWFFEQLQHVYQAASAGFRKYTSTKNRHSLFRLFILLILQSTFEFILSINFPMLFLCLAMAGIISWMTPKWRKQWLVPLLIRLFLAVLRWFPSPYLKQMYNHMLHLTKKKPYTSKEESTKEYDADGIHHRGAITMQNIFNQQQYRTNVKHVEVRTLSNQHTTDVQSLDSNAKHSLVSVGQDGKMILWNTRKGVWMARLDKLLIETGGLLRATLNPDFYNLPAANRNNTKMTAATRQALLMNQKKRKATLSAKTTEMVTLSKHYSTKPRCVKTDQGNKWVAASYDDGVIRVWDVNTGLIVRELDAHPHMHPVEVQQEQPHSSRDSYSAIVAPSPTFTLRNRSHRPSPQSSSENHSYSSSTSSFSNSSPFKSSRIGLNQVRHKKTRVDHILFIQFLGNIAEFCHPSIAAAAARCSDIEVSQNYLISAHKSGTLHEWDILTGECIHTIKTQHTKDITQLHIVESKAPQRKFGVTWVFTASKDGTVHCWERYLNNGSTTAATATATAVNKTNSLMIDDMEELGQHQQQQPTRWSLLYTVKLDSPITCIATETPVGGMGVLVTGDSDGTVKVWNFESGEYICTLSSGKAMNRANGISRRSSEFYNAFGGPIRQFSRFSTHNSVLRSPLSSSPSSSSEEEEEEEKEIVVEKKGKSAAKIKNNYVSRITSSSTTATDTAATTKASSSSGAPTTHSQRRFSSAADHRGTIYHVTVTRYCEVENGPGLCRGCDTCFGNGFLIASSSADNKVHAWRLERADSSGHEGSCTLCTKDYHRKQYNSNSSSRSTRRRERRRRRSSVSSSGGDDIIATTAVNQTGRRSNRGSRGKVTTVQTVDGCHTTTTASSNSPAVVRKRSSNRTVVKNTIEQNDTMELLDIEQLAGDVNIVLKPSFLGKIQQTGGKGVVFCDKILAGVRRVRKESADMYQKTTRATTKNNRASEWEVWFASLQYYDPAISKLDGQINFKDIPVETFALDVESHQDGRQDAAAESDSSSTQHTANTTSQLKESLLGLFKPAAPYRNNHDGNKDSPPHLFQQRRFKRIHAYTPALPRDRNSRTKFLDSKKDNFKSSEIEGNDGDEDQDNLLDASENLPFTAVRHVIPLDGSGLACDFGNFIKIVLLDKPSLTEKEYLKYTRDLMEDHKSRQKVTLPEELLLEEKDGDDEQDKEQQQQQHQDRHGCQCGGDDNACSPATKGKDGCCGGVNKEKNGGKCCGGSKRRKGAVNGNVRRRTSGMVDDNARQIWRPQLASTTITTMNGGSNVCGGYRSIAECSLKNNCSRAAECASKKNQVLYANRGLTSLFAG